MYKNMFQNDFKMLDCRKALQRTNNYWHYALFFEYNTLHAFWNCHSNSLLRILKLRVLYKRKKNVEPSS